MKGRVRGWVIGLVRGWVRDKVIGICFKNEPRMFKTAFNYTSSISKYATKNCNTSQLPSPNEGLVALGLLPVTVYVTDYCII